MGIGLGTLRSARLDGRGANAGAGVSHPTIREVCLIGMDSRLGDQKWATAQQVTWLGRDYRVTASVAAPAQPIEDVSCPTSSRHYVHLAPCNGE
jgi:hypothetical protein